MLTDLLPKLVRGVLFPKAFVSAPATSDEQFERDHAKEIRTNADALKVEYLELPAAMERAAVAGATAFGYWNIGVGEGYDTTTHDLEIHRASTKLAKQELQAEGAWREGGYLNSNYGPNATVVGREAMSPLGKFVPYSETTGELPPPGTRALIGQEAADYLAAQPRPCRAMFGQEAVGYLATQKLPYSETQGADNHYFCYMSAFLTAEGGILYSEIGADGINGVPGYPNTYVGNFPGWLPPTDLMGK